MPRRDGLARTVLRLYPRAWRARYGDELGALLDAMPVSWRVRADLVRGAAREWLHELVRPHPRTPAWRLAWRTLSLVLTSVGLAAAIVLVSRYLAFRWAGVDVPVLVMVGIGALLVGLAGRVFMVLRGASWRSRSTRPRVVSYLEFAVWVGVAGTAESVFAMDSATPTPAWLAVVRWWMWMYWLLAATPRAVRHARIEQRLMRRPRVLSQAMIRFERRRAENAARLIEFYSRFTIGSAGSFGPIASEDPAAAAERGERP
jgi:hypothetical protein